MVARQTASCSYVIRTNFEYEVGPYLQFIAVGGEKPTRRTAPVSAAPRAGEAVSVSGATARRPTRNQQRNQFMSFLKNKRVIGLVALLIIAGVALTSIPAARADQDNQTQVLPSPTC